MPKMSLLALIACVLFGWEAQAAFVETTMTPLLNYFGAASPFLLQTTLVKGALCACATRLAPGHAAHPLRVLQHMHTMGFAFAGTPASLKNDTEALLPRAGDALCVRFPFSLAPTVQVSDCCARMRIAVFLSVCLRHRSSRLGMSHSRLRRFRICVPALRHCRRTGACRHGR